MNDIVYHYTSFEVLRKILMSSKLRFSKMNSLNDRSEYHYGIQLLKNKIIEYEIKNNITNKFDSELLEKFSFPNNLFSVSFTKNGDDLAFWNSYYVDKTMAVCIGFIKDKVFDSNYIINRCIYGDPYPPMSRERYIWFTEIFKHQNILQLSKNREYIQITFQTAHIKNKAFEIEQELRAVSFDVNGNESGKFMRNGKEVEFFDQKFNLDSIHEIIIGPSSLQNDNYLQVEELIKDKMIKCSLKKSVIPLEL
ncbi:hypothetical protein [Elizabethkingia anophelis]|uniref:hypothetical protein n=1 Tax=Elizabethkingia anophelis TaxID=1117645 RepID=UPI00372F0DB5